MNSLALAASASLARRIRLARLCSVAFVSIAASACGSDSPSEPTNASITGSWSYNASNIVGGGITCAFSGVTLALTQTGSTFTGTTTGGNVHCTAVGIDPLDEPLGPDVITNGQVNGNTIAFDISTEEIHNSGTLSGNSISGTVTLRVPVGTSTVSLVGTFTAVKK